MKIPDPYKCDECGAQKGATNHWYLGFVVTGETNALAAEQGDRTVIAPWHEPLLDRPGTKHLCGAECVTKFVLKNLPLSPSGQKPAAQSQ